VVVWCISIWKRAQRIGAVRAGRPVFRSRSRTPPPHETWRFRRFVEPPLVAGDSTPQRATCWIAVASATTALAGTVLANAIGIAVAGAEVFGVSMALGAFLADERRLERIAHQPHDCMLLDPCVLLSAPAMVIATLAVILLGKAWAPDLCHLPMAHGVPVYLRHSR
jgi:hypothetical protein